MSCITCSCIQFSTPAYVVPGQLPYLPMTFITYEVASIDNQNHQVKIYYDNTAEVGLHAVYSILSTLIDFNTKLEIEEYYYSTTTLCSNT